VRLAEVETLDVCVPVLLREIEGLLVRVPERVAVRDIVCVAVGVSVTSAVPERLPVIVCD